MANYDQSSDLAWHKLGTEVIHQDRWIHLRADTCRTPRGAVITPYYVLDYPDWVNALCLTTEGKVVLIEIYRHGIERSILELPGGIVEVGEDPEQTVRRELLEETGYVFAEAHHLHRISPNPSNHSNYCFGYLLLGGQLTSEPKPEAAESIRTVILELQEVERLLETNQIVQAMHCVTLMYGLEKLRSLRSLRS